jgi:general secretion pathway protein A
MYVPFFGLKQKPFSIAPDPRYLFMSERHREALAHLLYGVQGGGGFVLLTGEIGAGKTTVCRCFLEQIPQRCNVAYIFNPKLSALELLITVCHEFGIKFPPLTAAGTAPGLKDYVDGLNEYLLRTHAVGQNNVLIIDEAQNLSSDVLEQLRLLTNLETSERKLLQIVLIGQPELRGMLARPELEQLAQRVIARYHLDALSEKETTQYIAHRFAVAGLKGAMPFDGPALRRIHQLARGVPRRINLLCDRALLGAYATGKARVDRTIVDKAAREVFGDPGEARPRTAVARWWPLALAAGVLAGAAAVAAVQWGGRGKASTNVAPAPASAASSGAPRRPVRPRPPRFPRPPRPRRARCRCAPSTSSARGWSTLRATSRRPCARSRATGRCCWWTAIPARSRPSRRCAASAPTAASRCCGCWLGPACSRFTTRRTGPSTRCWPAWAATTPRWWWASRPRRCR